MGRPKLALPLGDKTVLECVLDILRQADVSDILVVISPGGKELIPLADKKAHILQLDQDTADMQATVLAGLDWLETTLQPVAQDYWLLLPADHPSLNPVVIRQLEQCRTEHPQHSIFIPTFAGKRGHPALIGWQHVAALRQFPPGQGLNRFLRQQTQLLECPMNAPEILLDLDTPEDYRRLLDHFSET